MKKPSKSRAKTPRGILLHAAKLIEEIGWIRGTFTDDLEHPTRFCALGAISMSVLGRPVPETAHPERYKGLPLYDSAVNVLGNHLGVSVSKYNDFMAKGPEDVVTAMRAAARGAQ